MAFWMDRKRDDFGVKGGWRGRGAIEEGRLNITFIFSTRRSPYCHLHLPLLFISSCKTGIFNIWIQSSRPELLFRCWKAGFQCEFGFISDLSKVFGVMQWNTHLYVHTYKLLQNKKRKSYSIKYSDMLLFITEAFNSQKGHFIVGKSASHFTLLALSFPAHFLRQISHFFSVTLYFTANDHNSNERTVWIGDNNSWVCPLKEIMCVCVFNCMYKW